MVRGIHEQVPFDHVEVSWCSFVPVPQNHCKGGPQDLRTVTAAIQRLAHRNHRHPPHAAGHGREVTRVASDAFSANMLLRAEACDLVLESIALAPSVRIVVWVSPAAWNGKVVCFRLQNCGERAVAVYVKVRVQTFRKRLHRDFTYIGKVLDIGMWASLFVVRRRSASDQGLSPWSVSSHQNCR